MARDKLQRGEWGKINRGQRDDGVWTARARLRDMTGLACQMYASSESGAKAEKKLVAKMKRRIRQQSSGILSSTTTLADASQSWQEHIREEGRLGDNTIYQHRLRLKNHVYPRIGDVELCDVSVSMLEKLIADIGDTVGKPTARTVRTTLCLLFDYCERLDVIDRNPARRTSTVYLPPTSPRGISIENIRLLLTGIRAFNDTEEYSVVCRTQTPVADIVWFMVGTGARAGEALSFNWGDVHFIVDGPSMIDVERTVTIDRNGRRTVGTTTKTGHNRTLTIPAFVEEMLVRRRALADDTSDDAPVFTSVDFDSEIKRTPTHQFYYQWDRFKKENEDFGWVKPHSFRKAVATLIAEKHGVTRAAKQMGHRSEATTIKHYIETNDLAPDSNDVFDQMILAIADVEIAAVTEEDPVLDQDLEPR